MLAGCGALELCREVGDTAAKLARINHRAAEIDVRLVPALREPLPNGGEAREEPASVL